VIVDGYAERLPLVGVAHGGVEGGAGDPDRPGGDVDATDLEGAEDVAEALSPPLVTPEHRRRRHPMAAVRHLHGLDALVAELADGLAGRDAAEAGPGILLDHEAGDALGGAGGEGD
jgi:hypothetical protein